MSIVFNFNGQPTLKFPYSQPDQSILGSITARLESSHRGIRPECPRKGDLAEEMRLDRFFGLLFGKKDGVYADARSESTASSIPRGHLKARVRRSRAASAAML